MYDYTPNLKHTIANKGSMKTLQSFIQIEMKSMIVIQQTERGLKVETTKINLATWQEMLLEKSIPQLEFYSKIKFGWM